MEILLERQGKFYRQLERKRKCAGGPSWPPGVSRWCFVSAEIRLRPLLALDFIAGKTVRRLFVFVNRKFDRKSKEWMLRENWTVRKNVEDVNVWKEIIINVSYLKVARAKWRHRHYRLNWVKNLFEKLSYEWWWQFSHYSNIPFTMFWTDIARFLQYFRNVSNSFINIFAILQGFNGIFSKYSFNITVLCGCNVRKYNLL